MDLDAAEVAVADAAEHMSRIEQRMDRLEELINRLVQESEQREEHAAEAEVERLRVLLRMTSALVTEGLVEGDQQGRS